MNKNIQALRFIFQLIKNWKHHTNCKQVRNQKYIKNARYIKGAKYRQDD